MTNKQLANTFTCLFMAFIFVNALNQTGYKAHNFTLYVIIWFIKLLIPLLTAFVAGAMARRLKENNLQEELQKMYDSEINVEISSFWDGDWRARIGDEMNGYKAPEFDCCTIDEIVPTLQYLIKEHYPNSDYAKHL